MQAHISSEEVQLKGCKALESITRHDCIACKNEAILHGTMDSIVRAMHNHRDNTEIQKLGCLTIVNLCQSEAAEVRRSYIETCGGIHCVVHVLQLQEQCHEVVYVSFLALWRLLCGESSSSVDVYDSRETHLEARRDRVVQYNTIQAIVWNMRLYMQHPKVQAMGCWALSGIAIGMESSKRKDRVVLCNGVQATISAMLQHQLDHEVQEAACFLLALLSASDAVTNGAEGRRNMIVSYGGVETVVVALEQHCEHYPDVARFGCLVLRNLVLVCQEQHPDTVISSIRLSENAQARRNHLVSNGGAGVVSWAMEDHILLEDIQESGCWVLYGIALGKDPDLKNEVVTCDGIEVVLSGMRVHAQSARVQAVACLVLAELIGSDPSSTSRAESMIQKGALSTVITAMRKHEAVESVQVASSALLAQLAGFVGLFPVPVNLGMGDVTELGVLEAVIIAMQRHAKDSETVAASGCAALTHLLTHDASPRSKSLVRNRLEHIIPSVAVDAVLLAMCSHKASVPVQVFGCAALRVLT